MNVFFRQFENSASTVTMKFLLHWVLLCIVIPVLSIVGNTTGNAGFTLAFPLIVIIYCGTRLAVIAAKGSNRIVEITFWLYVYIFLGVSAFLQIGANHFPWAGHYSDGAIVSAQLLIMGGMVAFDFGRHVKFGRRNLSTIAVTSRFEMSRNRLYLIAAFGMVVTAYATEKLGGFFTLFLNRNERYAIISGHYDIAQMAIYNSLAKTIVYVLLVATVAHAVYDLKGQKTIHRLPVYALAIVLGLFTMVENNPIATPRFQVGTIILSLYFVLPWKKYKASIAIYGLILGLLIIFPYASMYRSSNDPNLKESIEKISNENSLIVSGDYDSFQQIMNGMRMVQNDGIQYGKQIVSSLLFWVPRSVWPDKAQPTGVLIAEKTGYSYLNLSAPLWIEYYVDGGWILVLVGFVLYGVFVRWVDDSRRTHVGASTPVFLFATVYAGYQIFLLRGSLMPAIAYLSPVVPVLLACGKRHRYRHVNTSLIHGDHTKSCKLENHL